MSFWSGKRGLICACEITSEMLISTRQAVRCQMIARTASAQGEYHLWVLRREGRTSSVTLSHCWLQWFRHTTSNGIHMPVYLLQSLNTMQGLCQESLEVAKKKKNFQHGLHLPVKNNWRCPTLLCLEPLQPSARISYFILYFCFLLWALVCV